MSENTQVVAGSEVETQVSPAVEVNGESKPVVTPKKVANVKKNTKKVAPKKVNPDLAFKSVPTKKTAAKKSAPAPAAVKKGTKKAAVKTAPTPTKKAATPAPVKTGTALDNLRKPQVKVILTLAKAGKPLTRAQIAKAGGIDAAGLTEWVGSADKNTREANDAKHFPSLISLGYVKVEQQDVDGRDVMVHSLSANGRKAAEKLSK